MRTKNYIAICLLSFAFSNFSCQKSVLKPTEEQTTSKLADARTLPRVTFGESLFSSKTKWSNPISQIGTDESIRRQLYPYNDNSTSKVKKYMLMEENLITQEIRQCNVISLKDIPGSVNLFAIPWKKEEVIYYRDPKAKLISSNIKSKIVLKYQNIITDLDNELGRLPACDNGGTQPVCIDWYWTEYNTDTGEIISETYISTTCYDPCTETGGGNGSGGDPNLDPEVEAYKNYYWKVYEPETHMWQIYSWEAFRGKRKAGEPQGGHFTRANHVESTCNYGLGIVYQEDENEMTVADQWVNSIVKGHWRQGNNGTVNYIEGAKLMGFNKIFP